MRIKTTLKDASVVKRSKSDFIITYFRASGPGGQHRNKVETAVRIKDKITGLVAEAKDSRSQSDNTKSAFLKLVKLIIKHYEDLQIDKSRDTNLGWDKKIRTYHAIRGEVLDHRTGKTAPYDLVLDGKLDKLW